MPIIVFLFLSLCYASAFGSTTIRKIVFGLSWFAQAQDGGYYQAIAKGYYKNVGLDVKIVQGGPDVHGQQLLVAGQYQVLMGKALNTIVAASRGLPVITVATIFQKSPAAILAHWHILKPVDLASHGNRILVSPSEQNTWWPWAMRRFGYSSRQEGIYTGSIIPFLVDRNIAEQTYMGTDGYYLLKQKRRFRTFLLADYGYPEYSETIETTRQMLEKHPIIVKKFVRASLEGWVSYLRNPEPGDKLIELANKHQSGGLLRYGYISLKHNGLILDGKVLKQGLGIMSNKRWLKIDQVAVRNHLVKSSFDYKRCYTLSVINSIHVTPMETNK